LTVGKGWGRRRGICTNGPAEHNQRPIVGSNKDHARRIDDRLAAISSKCNPRLNPTVKGYRRSRLERHADKVAVAPDQSAKANRAKVIERNAEFRRHDVRAVQSKTGAIVGDIANTTIVDAILTGEKHQHVSIDCRAVNGAALKSLPEAWACD
jgi:hypothetical protein